MTETNNKNIKKPRKSSFMKELLSGSMISEKLILNNLGFIAYVALLAAIHIASGYHAEKITRETARLQKEVKDLQAESLATSAELMFISRQSQVYRMVREKGLDLEELKTPPYKLIVNSK